MFELVKNSYDADATHATVFLEDIADQERGTILVQDDGGGMNWETVTNVWLEPGTDYRAAQRTKGQRTPRFGRMPLGEKGVGRFAAHKLGTKVSLVTRARGSDEVVVSLDWDRLESAKYLSDTRVSVSERAPIVFTGRTTGTQIRIEGLRDRWTRGLLRNTYRSAISITSPFKGPDDFETLFSARPDYGWLDDLIDPKHAIGFALFHATGTIAGGSLTYDYVFNPLPGMTLVEPRDEKQKTVPLSSPQNSAQAENHTLEGFRIGDVGIELHIFDRDRQVMQFVGTDPRGLRELLDNNGGIRVYRDGVRVFDYGEPGNDWLDLSGQRVNVPAARISNNIVLGAVTLSLEKSQDLVEKTNREGFVENAAYSAFEAAVRSAVTHIVAERNNDKERMRKAYGPKATRLPVLDAIDELRSTAEKLQVEEQLRPYIDRIEREFRGVQENLLTAATAGLGLTVVIHEVERGVSTLNRILGEGADLEEVTSLAVHLAELMDGLTYLTRKSGRSIEKGSVLARQAVFNMGYRLRTHEVKLVNAFEQGAPDFSVKCSRRLVVSTLMNLIDNAIYWLEVKGGTRKKILIAPSTDLDEGPALVVADSGPGFVDAPELLVQPFVSRKPDGMGLGLHLADRIMQVHGGRLAFPRRADIGIAREFTGGIVALVFESQ